MLALPQGHHMMISAACPQIRDALVTRHKIEPPRGYIKLLRSAEIRSFKIDAAQRRDRKMRHCRRRPQSVQAFLQCRRRSPASRFLGSLRVITYKKRNSQQGFMEEKVYRKWSGRRPRIEGKDWRGHKISASIGVIHVVLRASEHGLRSAEEDVLSSMLGAKRSIARPKFHNNGRANAAVGQRMRKSSRYS
jgi:hypothetical protein